MQVQVYRDEKWPYTFVEPVIAGSAPQSIRDVPEHLIETLKSLRAQEEAAIQEIDRHLRSSGQEPIRS